MPTNNAAMQAGSATNGWDAICAMNLPQVNALLFQQYLRNGPTSPAMPLRLILNAESQFWILDVVLGPPELSFQAGSQNATLEMELVRGSLIAFNPLNNTVQTALLIRPKESKLTGPLSLKDAPGEENQLGKVVVDLGASAYTPAIAGVDPKSVLSTEIGNAFQTYFSKNATQFPIGTIAPGNVPACLTPTKFYFMTQQKSNSNDGCVVLLIKTNGKEGTVAPLPQYPIPDNHSAALLVSGQVVFSGLMIDYLNNVFAKQGTKFKASQNNGVWTVGGVGGGVNFGVLGNPADTSSSNVWSCKGPWDEWKGKPETAEVVVPLDGFTIQNTANGLVACLNVKQTGYWTHYYFDVLHPEISHWSTDQAVVQVTYSLQSQPIVDPVSDVVTFPGKGTVNVEQVDAPGWLWKLLFGAIALPDILTNGMSTALQHSFDNFQLPSVNVFALANLLFPARHVMSLKDAAIESDLCLSGSLAAPIEVTPSASSIAPGATVQFNASGQAASDVLWEINPRFGSISPTGLYTAQASIPQAQVIVATAIKRTDPSVTGSAMVLVYNSPAAGGVAVAPGSSVVTPGQTLQLSVIDAAGNPASADWTLSPNVGQISERFGQYIYTAPSSIASPTEVTVTAKNHADPSKSGVAVIRVTPPRKVTVTPTEATVEVSGTLALTAAASPGDTTDVCWAVYPIGVGMVTPDSSNPGKAIYTAPHTIGQNPDVTVVAYLVDDKAAGLGASAITLHGAMGDYNN